MIYRWKHPNTTAHLLGILQGFCEIADGLITICSLGFFSSGFEMCVARLRAKTYLQQQKGKP
jgi:hypothetical protein